MSNIELDPIGSGFNRAKINDNFQKIEDHINTELLSRTPDLGQDNAMEAELDMNGNAIINANTDLTDDKSLVTLGDADERYINADGDTMSGVLQHPTPPTTKSDVVNKEYADSVASGATLVGVLEEEVSLSSGQTAVVFPDTNCLIAAFYVCSDGAADKGRLCRGDDFSVVDADTIELVESYPAGTRILAVVNDPVYGEPVAQGTFLQLEGRSSESIPNGAIFVDVSDNLLKFKDSEGTVKTVQVM